MVDQVLVKWKDISKQEATWEDSEEMLQSYSNLNLEDKIALEGEGNVMGENEELDDDVAKDKKIRRSNRIKKKHPMWTQFVSE